MCEKKLMCLILVLSVFIIGCMSDSQKSETEWYADNIIIEDLSIETYNRSYKELNNSEKEHIIRIYRIKDYFKEETIITSPSVHPVVVPT